MTKVGIVVVNYNGEKYIDKCLQSLQGIKATNLKTNIWIIDNDSSDGSCDLIRKKYNKFNLVKSRENLGYAGGNNLGIKHAREWEADFVWIVNPDLVVDELALVELVQLAQSKTKAGIIGSKVYFTPGHEYHAERYKNTELGKVIWYAGGGNDWKNVYAVHAGMNEVDRGQFDVPTKTQFVSGSSMLLSKPMLDEIGALDHKYFLYYEENDLCQRALRSGWELWYEPKSVVWHANAQSTGVGSPLVDYYTTRNRLLFGMRWAPLRSKLALVRESLRFILSGREWQRKGVIDFYLGRFGKGSYHAD